MKKKEKLLVRFPSQKSEKLCVQAEKKAKKVVGGQGRARKIKKIYVQILRWAKFRPRARDARVDGFAASKGKRLK